METRSPLLRYAIAVGAVGLAFVLTVLLQEKAEANVFAVFLAAVMLSAWSAGLGPGLLATVVAGLTLDYFFISPIHTIALDLGHLQRLTVFGLVALLISSLTGARKRSEEALRKARQDLEVRVQERTAELAQANVQLQGEIIERKTAELQAAQAARELAERNKELWRLQAEMGRVERLVALGRVSGTIAHELGTPLNSVLGYAHLLSQETLSERARRRLDIIKAQIERMTAIIDQYLTRARSSFQPRQRVAINELVGETMELFKPIFEQHRAEVSISLAESLPVVSGDEASLQRVLINLLDNAVDAIEDGGAVTVATRPTDPSDEAGPGVIIEIADTGAGIPSDLLPKIFEFLVTTKPAGKGTGLGLAICQEIVKGHGGSINISSLVGKGTTVRVFLPADDGAGKSAGAEASE